MPHSLPRIAPLIASSMLALLAACAWQKPQPPLFDGWLCCNMQGSGGWISDINYRSEGGPFIPAGTKVTVTGYGRSRVLLQIDGRKLALGNDFSRTLALPDFARRYIVASDPGRVYAGYPVAVRNAIKEAKVARDMTREQVVMSLGYPVTTYTADLDAPLWRYWLNSSEEFQVFWSADGRVDRVFGSPEVRAKVALE